MIKQFIKLTFTTRDTKTNKAGKITANVFDGFAFIKFANQEQTTFTYNALIKAGKKAVYTRGMVRQMFVGKKKEEIKDILKEDIKNGLKATDKSKAKIVIEDYVEEIR